MIAQARITSDRAATVHLADDTVDIRAEQISEVRADVKRLFIDMARRAGTAQDVVIIEADARHHLRVEPSGRITSRPADDRPVFGPDSDTSAATGENEVDEETAPSAGQATTAAAPVADGSDPADPADAADAAGPADEDESADDLEATIVRPVRRDATSDRVDFAPVPAEDSAPASPATPSSETSGPGWVPPRLLDTEDADTPQAPDAPSHEDTEPPVAAPVEQPARPARPGHGRRAAAFSPTPAPAPEASEAPVSAPEATPANTPELQSQPQPSDDAASRQASAAQPTAATLAAQTAGIAPAQTPAPAPEDHAQAAPATQAPTGQGPDGQVPAAQTPFGQAPVGPGGSPAAGGGQRPTLQDLQANGRTPAEAPATRGWQGALTRLTGGRISPRPGRAEQEERAQIARIARRLDSPKNIAVVNLKGGAHKTTASLMIASTLGLARGGDVLAWDNNETRGTLGWRAAPTEHERTAIDLLHDLDSLRSAHTTASALDPYVRRQEAARFDILASDEDPGSSALIDDVAFRDLDEALSRFYRIKVIDTGNNVRASNWLASVRSADQLVIISTLREDTFNAAAWMIDELRATGLAEQVDHAVTILSHSSRKTMDPSLRSVLHQHFGAHTRAVVEVPYEEQFVDGAPLDISRIHRRTREAWLKATAEIVDGL
ncbi:chromosome partitioning protein [Brachybacterium endophyticum]|uniref:Chromosome partitioning protein n=1 Tax=Brachybacterium endophyticum TaxID=2182385 RepID=A0A2U2RJX3_9MICO|nr:chromosome partitioning protein [Brachybacterium endophyticum]PWH06167.1 chromosome partitioning protein [Brachybacterium endophyticum]